MKSPKESQAPGLKRNWQQFTLLVVINAFVGGMVGMERTIFPELARSEFGVASTTAVLSFIIAFGVTKALANYYTGRLANRWGRRKLLILGWILALPIPFILIFAPNWSWVVFANILLGASQGLAWSSTVVMKIDLVGKKNRGLAMGLNEFSGYLAVGVVAYFTGYLADEYGVTPYPFYLGMAVSIIGLVLTLIWVKDTRPFVHHETRESTSPELKHVFTSTSFKDKNLSSITQAGLVNNLNDGMIWGLLPILLMSYHYDNQEIGKITAIYPAVWGVGQLFTGRLGDLYPIKALLFWGMLLQGVTILFIPISESFWALAALSVLLGLGTALVYPTFLTGIAMATSPRQRAESIGTFRLWRDLGYAIGAVISGVAADILGVNAAIMIIGGITILSALVIKVRMPVKPVSP